MPEIRVNGVSLYSSKSARSSSAQSPSRRCSSAAHPVVLAFVREVLGTKDFADGAD